MKTQSPSSLKLFAALLVFVIGCSDAASQRDKVTHVADNDPDMVAAIAKARATLPEFWQVFDRHGHGESDFCLKVKITDQKESEHCWLGHLERRDGKIFGTIDNEVKIVKCVKLGDRMQIPEADISDWLYMRNGKMVGNYTLRALFKTMSPEELESAKKILANP